MKKNYLASVALTSISILASIGAIAEAILLSGAQERITLQITGVILVGSSILSTRYDNTLRRQIGSLDDGDQDRTVQAPWWDNLIAIVVISAGVTLGYFVYIVPYDFDLRKLYIIVACSVAGVGTIVGRLLRRTIKGDKPSGGGS